MAELISGNVDFGLNYTPDVWEILEKSPQVAPLEVPILRINFWQFDGSGVASKGTLERQAGPAGHHPCHRPQGHHSKGHGGPRRGAVRSLQPSGWGYDPAVKQLDYPYNPEKAKALLKQAGYEKGFPVDLW